MWVEHEETDLPTFLPSYRPSAPPSAANTLSLSKCFFCFLLYLTATQGASHHSKKSYFCTFSHCVEERIPHFCTISSPIISTLHSSRFLSILNFKTLKVAVFQLNQYHILSDYCVLSYYGYFSSLSMRSLTFWANKNVPPFNSDRSRQDVSKYL